MSPMPGSYLWDSGTHLVRIEDSEELSNWQATLSWDCVPTRGLELQLETLNIGGLGRIQ